MYPPPQLIETEVYARMPAELASDRTNIPPGWSGAAPGRCIRSSKDRRSIAPAISIASTSRMGASSASRRIAAGRCSPNTKAFRTA